MGTDGIHFFAHDVLDLSKNTHAQGQEGVHTACNFPDHACADKQTMACNLGVGGVFFQRGAYCWLKRMISITDFLSLP